MFDIRQIININIADKLVYSLNVAIGNEEIVANVLKTKGEHIKMVLLSEEKLFYFESDGKTSHTDVFTYDEVKEIIVTQRKKEYRFAVFLENGQRIDFADVDYQSAKNLKEIFDKISSSLNETFLKTTKDDYISKEKKQSRQEKILENFNNKPEQKANGKQSRIVDDNKISVDTTFSSKYINELFSKRNTFLPNGALNTVDKLWSKVDDLEIDVASFENKLNSKFATIDEKQNECEENIDRFNEFMNTEIKNIIKSNQDDLDEYLKSETTFLNKKIESESAKLRKEDEKTITKIKDLSDTLSKKFLAIQEEQLTIVDKIKNALDDHKVNSKEIYVTQKAWLESNRLIKKNEDALIELESFFKKHIARIDDMFGYKKNDDERIIVLEKSINKFLEENMVFNQTISKKIEMLENRQHPATKANPEQENKYKEIQEKYSDLIAINKAIEKQFNKISEEIEGIREQFSEQSNSTSPNNKSISESRKGGSSNIETFTAKSYTINGERRYGLRSSQTIRLKTLENELGLDALYVSDRTGEYLNIDNFDGLYFKNQKYYFSIPNEFEIENKKLCKINYIEYENGVKVFRNYQITLNNNLIEYRVYNEKGIIFNDSVVSSSKYDLKKITFFKD